MTDILTKRGHSDPEPHTGEFHAKMKAEIAVMQQKTKDTKDCQEPPEARREAVNTSIPHTIRGRVAPPDSDL